MASEDEDPTPKRRRVIAEEDDDEDDNDSNNNDNNNSDENNNSDDDDDDNNQDTLVSRRAARLEQRATQRRRRRQLQEEVLQLAGDNPDDFQSVDDNNNNGNNGNDSDTGDADMEEDQDYDYEDATAAAAVEEEEEEGEDLLEHAERDYQRIEALDTYGTEGLDDRDYDAMDMDQRRAAERELAHRERGEGGRNDGFYGLLDAMETEEDDDARQARRGVFARVEDDDEEDAEGEETDEEDLDGDDQINLEAFDVPLCEWIAQDRTRREIQRKFRSFLRHYTGEPVNEEDTTRRRKRGNGIYEHKIRAMCAANQSTLQVSFLHLSEAEPVLGYWLTDVPKDMLDVLNEAATRHTLMLFPSYNAIQGEIHVRISDVPFLDSLRDLRRTHLDNLVKVHGVVTRRSTVYPQLSIAYYTCLNCKRTQGPFRVDGVGSNLGGSHEPDSCPNQFCENTQVHFKLHPSLSQYRNYQRANLQETPGSVPPGRVPRTKEVVFTDDLIDSARPGEEVEVTGIYEQKFDNGLTLSSGFPVFSTFLTANHVRKREDASAAANLSEKDIQEILELGKDPNIGQRIVQSIAPSIFGHDFCKMALAMSLFGAVPKNVDDKHRIRGDVNVLLLGDPGTAKSQLLKYAEHTAPRAVYSTGKGASAVGLTASVHKDPVTREWTLEGGALVLADKGVCLIDEFDKVSLVPFDLWCFGRLLYIVGY